MIIHIALASLFVTAVIDSKSISRNNSRMRNEIDNEGITKVNEDVSNVRKKMSLRGESLVDQNEISIEDKINNNEGTIEENVSIKPQQVDNVLTLLSPIFNRWKFTPQTFLQDRINALRQTLGNFGIVVPLNNATTSKQLVTASGLLQLVGLNDSGFYTDRFEPAGFLGGNGWFANKGGILGGPGAILSTGSILTDYPTPYRK